MSGRRTLAVAFGGRSVEHEVSLDSAGTILRAADPDRYTLVPLRMDHDGRWYTGEAEALLDREGTAQGTRVLLPTDPVEPFLRKPDGQPASPPLDVVFPIIHGSGGEDGALQGLLETAGIPFVGAGVTSSAVCMDKLVAKPLLRAAGLEVVPWVEVDAPSWSAAREEVLARVSRLSRPLFVKPANGGSSVGVSRVESDTELAEALTLALELDRRALVEEGIAAREIECAVLGNDAPECAPPGEVVPGNVFYDYEAKYQDAGSTVHVPAELPAGQVEEVRALALRVYRALGIEGLARVDFLLERVTDRLLVNEANTLPGFTEISVFPKAWAAAGVPLPALVDRLVDLALERAEARRRMRTRWRPGD